MSDHIIPRRPDLNATSPITPDVALSRKLRRPRRDFWERVYNDKLDEAMKANRDIELGYFIGSVIRIFVKLFIIMPFMLIVDVFHMIGWFFRNINEIMVLSVMAFGWYLIGLAVYLSYLTWWN